LYQFLCQVFLILISYAYLVLYLHWVMLTDALPTFDHYWSVFCSQEEFLVAYVAFFMMSMSHVGVLFFANGGVLSRLSYERKLGKLFSILGVLVATKTFLLHR
jgi:hypothetical protein